MNIENISKKYSEESVFFTWKNENSLYSLHAQNT